MKNLKSHFLLDSEIVYLNHGSFGACPKFIFNDYIKIQKELEKNPIKFLDNDIQYKVKRSQIALSKFINCDEDDIVFFPNPTTAMNEVFRSINLKIDDEILSTNHEYGALNKAWDFITLKTGAKYIQTKIPIPLHSHIDFINRIESKINKNTKVIFLSHITSSTGLIFPVKEIIELAKKYGIISIIDGAHVPGHINLDISKLNPDIYTGTCHKWMLSPKGVSFLYVKKEIQNQIDPLIISWGYANEKVERSSFQDEHLWQGTKDISPYLTISKTLEFREKHNWENISNICKKRIIEFGVEIKNKLSLKPLCSLDSKFLGQMLSFDLNLPVSKLNQVLNILRANSIVIPIFEWENKLLMRISLNGYNSEDDIQRLLLALNKIIKL
tara:strand:- start:34 stop:1185 length:1152 start_codon:yes stop_codon:yes gene_type:complete